MDDEEWFEYAVTLAKGRISISAFSEKDREFHPATLNWCSVAEVNPGSYLDPPVLQCFITLDDDADASQSSHYMKDPDGWWVKLVMGERRHINEFLSVLRDAMEEKFQLAEGNDNGE